MTGVIPENGSTGEPLGEIQQETLCQGSHEVDPTDLNVSFSSNEISETGELHNQAVAQEVTIVNKLGLHARPVSELYKLASAFHSEITLRVLQRPRSSSETYNNQADAKSTFQLIMLMALKDTRIEISASGHDSQEAVETLADFFQRGLGEPE